MPPVDFRLYLVTDRYQTAGRPLVSVLRRAIGAGVASVQLRERDLDTHSLMSLVDKVMSIRHGHPTKVLINDRPDLTAVLKMSGVHLRANGFPIPVTRSILGSERFIGVSAHSAEEVVRAEADGADFVVLGPIYDTPSKRVYGPPLGLACLENICRRSRIPVFAIGGITASRARVVRQAGAFGVAVVSAILAAENIERATTDLIEAVTAT
ncbi:MAG: thiamine phosphate synthase [Nitrospiraceae bacterium]